MIHCLLVVGTQGTLLEPLRAHLPEAMEQAGLFVEHIADAGTERDIEGLTSALKDAVVARLNEATETGEAALPIVFTGSVFPLVFERLLQNNDLDGQVNLSVCLLDCEEPMRLSRLEPSDDPADILFGLETLVRLRRECAFATTPTHTVDTTELDSEAALETVLQWVEDVLPETDADA